LYFTASPDHITPLGSSILKWDTVLADGAALYLDGHPVPSAGSDVVAPAVTTTYTLSVTAPRTSPEPQVSELIAEPPVPLGNATVFVDASQCVQQTQTDLQNRIQVALDEAYDVGAQSSGIPGTATGYPAVSITTGLITVDMKGTATVVVVANVGMKGSFGLTIDHAADQLAPVIESSHVSCSVSASVWAAAVAAGAVSAAAAGWAIGGAIGGVFGGVIGAIAGAVAGAIAGGVTLNTVINKATSKVEANMPLLLSAPPASGELAQGPERVVSGDFPFSLHASTGPILERFPDNLTRRHVSTPGACFSAAIRLPPGMSGSPIFDHEGIYVHGVVSKGWDFEPGVAALGYGSMLAHSLPLPLKPLGNKSLLDLHKSGDHGLTKLSGPGL
jgi:hypothetical protein